MARKAPRRTAERILEAALDLFNRLGEPNVSTTAIAAQLGISPGNLYYHYPAKEAIVNALSQRHTEDLHEVLQAGGAVRDMAAAWVFVHALLERLWAYRFLYRDINDLVSRNRDLETLMPQVLAQQAQALRQMLQALRAAGALEVDAHALEPTANAMLLVLAYWPSFEFVRAPRRPHQPAQVQDTLHRGTSQVLHLLAPYLAPRQRRQLADLMQSQSAAPGMDGQIQD
ncbi:MAG: hypothetical protein RIS88_1556 [Pseudomonadota bacterium]|jgi:AcrR family transcriptional regulator